MSYYLELLDKNGLQLSDDAIACRNAQGLAVERIEVQEGDETMSKLFKACLDQEERRQAVIDGVRVCSQCRIPKDPSHYSRNKNKPDGLDARCKVCKKQLARLRYLERKR